MTLRERDEELAALESLLAAAGLAVIEGGPGIGKTALVDAACRRASELGFEVLRARGSEMETAFAFGVVRQLFERRLSGAAADERATILAGHARAACDLIYGPVTDHPADTSFSVLHGLYWLSANLAALRPVLIAVDDAHWADRASLQWLAYLATRLEGLAVSMLLAVRPADPAADAASLLAIQREAAAVLRPGLLSEGAVADLARDTLGAHASVELCARLKRSSGGNPFFLEELLRAIRSTSLHDAAHWHQAEGEAARDVLQYLAIRLSQLGPTTLRFARAAAVLGDDCALHQVATLAGQGTDEALQSATVLLRSDVLGRIDPVAFLHPLVRTAVEESLSAGEHAGLHRAAARLLHREHAPPGLVAAHLHHLPPAGDAWVCSRLREAAAAAANSGAPNDAADLLRRAWAEPPPPVEQLPVLRELTRAEVAAGRGTARRWLEEALARADDPRERALIAAEVAAAHAALFCWVEAVDVLEVAVEGLGDGDRQLTDRLLAALVVAGLHDARRAAHVAHALHGLDATPTPGETGESLAVARGMAALLAGRPAVEVAAPLTAALYAGSDPVSNWDTRAALLWCLVTAEAFDTVEAALEPMLTQLRRTGSARGLIAVYSASGLLRLRLGALAEAESAARTALRVLQEGDFAPGLPFAATVLADIAVEAGHLDEARSLLELLPARDGPPGVGTALIPAAWGRLHLAAGRPAEAVAAFQACAAMFSADIWGLDVRDVGYLHARSGAAQALLLLGDHAGARRLADAELADVRTFGAPRALGVALRAAGLAHGGGPGLELLSESAIVLSGSPAVLEQAKSLAELGAAQRRNGQRTAARETLAEALDLTARCGARPLAGRIRDELTAAGARPRRERRRGVEALTLAEQRVAQLAAYGRTNREIAQMLYVTVKTVEGHLAHVYAKLGIASRSELAGCLEPENSGVPTG